MRELNLSETKKVAGGLLPERVPPVTPPTISYCGPVRLPGREYTCPIVLPVR